jgi:hypothetical protein
LEWNDNESSIIFFFFIYKYDICNLFVSVNYLIIVKCFLYNLSVIVV